MREEERQPYDDGVMEQKEIDNELRTVTRQARELNIPVPDNIWGHVRINPRPRKRFGCCRRENGKFIIEISGFITDCDAEKIRNVLAHEILHTCPGCSNHGKMWKKYASAMNAAYGYHIKRTSSFDEMGLDDPAELAESADGVHGSGNAATAHRRSSSVKYIIKCRKCGREYPRKRRSKVVKEIGNYRCSCGGRLTVYKETIANPR